jgi:excisionase family DNA binding protein
MMRTIKETAVITGLPVHAIRTMVKEQKIVFVRCGKKILVNVGKLIEYLEKGESRNERSIGEYERDE